MWGIAKEMRLVLEGGALHWNGQECVRDVWWGRGADSGWVLLQSEGPCTLPLSTHTLALLRRTLLATPGACCTPALQPPFGSYTQTPTHNTHLLPFIPALP